MKKYNKILLIWPYFERIIQDHEVLIYKIPPPRLPLGLAYIKAYVKQFGYEVEILDLNLEGYDNPFIHGNKQRFGLSDEEVLKKIKKFSPNVVGISQMFSYLFPICQNIFAIVKSINKDIITVIGGTHPTVAPKDCLDDKNIDFVILGEGELPFKELMDRLNNGESLVGMKSLGFRSQCDYIINDERMWVDDLDAHVLPFRDKTVLNKYISYNAATEMVTSRGCPFSCTFCTAKKFYQNRYKARSCGSVIDEITILLNEYGVKKIIMDDENLTYDMNRFERICDMIIEKELKFEWFAEVGLSVAKLDYKLLKKMKMAGFSVLRLAVESGDIQTLKNMRKPLKIEQSKRVVHWARELGLKPHAFILIGMPGETVDQMENTIKFCIDVGFDWTTLSIVNPLPGTKIHEDLIKQGFQFEYDDYERYQRPSKAVGDEALIMRIKDKANFEINFKYNYNLTRGDSVVAEADFLNLLKMYPEIGRVWFFYGLSLYKNGKCGEARNAFEQAERLKYEIEKSRAMIVALSNKNNFEQNGAYLKNDIEQKIGYEYGRIHDLPTSVA